MTSLNIIMFLMPSKLPEYQWLLSYEILSDFLENSKPNTPGSLKKYWTMPDPYFPYLLCLPNMHTVRRHLGIVCSGNNNGDDAVHVYPLEFLSHIFFTRPTDVFADAHDERALT